MVQTDEVRRPLDYASNLLDGALKLLSKPSESNDAAYELIMSASDRIADALTILGDGADDA